MENRDIIFNIFEFLKIEDIIEKVPIIIGQFVNLHSNKIKKELPATIGQLS